MTCGQIDAPRSKSLQHPRIITLEENSQTHVLGISSPVQKQVKEVPSPDTEGQIQWAAALKIGVITLTQKQQG